MAWAEKPTCSSTDPKNEKTLSTRLTRFCDEKGQEEEWEEDATLIGVVGMSQEKEERRERERERERREKAAERDDKEESDDKEEVCAHSLIYVHGHRGSSLVKEEEEKRRNVASYLANGAGARGGGSLRGSCLFCTWSGGAES